jgi:glutathione S-transferase
MNLFIGFRQIAGSHVSNQEAKNENMLAKLTEILTNLELELKPKFIVSETIGIADFCLAALFFDILDSDD